MVFEPKRVLIETVVFDLGGVLVDWNPRYLYRQLFADEREMESFLADVCHGDWNLAQDAGRSFAEATAELVAKHPEKEELIRAYFDRWPEMIKGPIEGTVEIFREIKRRPNRPRIYALSNWSSETFPLAKGRFPFLDWFDGVLLSGLEKLVKPDPKFFELLKTRFGVDPLRAVFIDDVEANVRAAQMLGYHVVRFQSPEALRRELTSIGVLS